MNDGQTEMYKSDICKIEVLMLNNIKKYEQKLLAL